MEAMQIKSVDFWRSFAPGFHVADTAFMNQISSSRVTPHQMQQLMTFLKDEGYFQGSNSWFVDLNAMANLVRALTAENLSPVFGFLFDEFWVPFFQLHLLYQALLGDKYYFLPDFWIWNVDPRKGESGWRPHRDKGKMALLPDGSPKSLTT